MAAEKPITPREIALREDFLGYVVTAFYADPNQQKLFKEFIENGSWMVSKKLTSKGKQFFSLKSPDDKEIILIQNQSNIVFYSCPLSNEAKPSRYYSLIPHCSLLPGKDDNSIFLLGNYFSKKDIGLEINKDGTVKLKNSNPFNTN